MTSKYRLQVKTHFDAAHLLEGYLGKCGRLHGHRWDVEFVFEGSQLDSQNMLIDFVVAKQLIKELIDRLDHYYLNDELQERHTTAEFVAHWLYEHMVNTFACANFVPLNHQLLSAVRRGVHLSRVSVWESPECCVKYYQEVDVPDVHENTKI